MAKPTRATIYALMDPRTKKIRYIGHTKNTLEHRLKWHMLDPRSHDFKMWRNELRERGLTPKILYLKRVPYSDRHKEERKAIIKYAQRGADLINHVHNHVHWAAEKKMKSE